jgi:hypothetical protein
VCALCITVAILCYILHSYIVVSLVQGSPSLKQEFQSRSNIHIFLLYISASLQFPTFCISHTFILLSLHHSSSHTYFAVPLLEPSYLHRYIFLSASFDSFVFGCWLVFFWDSFRISFSQTLITPFCFGVHWCLRTSLSQDKKLKAKHMKLL